MNLKNGFTLVELLVVISMVGILSVIGIGAYSEILRNARAGKIMADFQQIKLAWKTWKNANDGLNYPRDDTYPQNPDYAIGCAGEPSVDQTAARAYLESTYRDPWQREYAYDNDGDAYPADSNWAGVNIIMRWCRGEGARYIDLAPRIDRVIDGGDGGTSGNVRWSGAPDLTGGIWFLIAPNEDF